MSFIIIGSSGTRGPAREFPQARLSRLPPLVGAEQPNGASHRKRSTIMSTRYIPVLCASALLGAAALQGTSAHALSMHECSAKYQAAKEAGTLGGMKWNDFRKAQCGASAAAAPSTTAQPATTGTSRPAATTRMPTGTGNAAFPRAVSPKYSGESAGKARELTCLDQYRANKAANANGGLRWIQKGGGYWSECDKHLKG
jgi:hypothetical protein